MPAAWETDAATATYWTIEVNDLNNEIVDGDNYVFVLVGLYFNPLTGSTTPLTTMTTTIFAA